MGYFILFYLFFSHASTFQLLDKPWSQVSSLLPPGSCLQFLSRMVFSNPTARLSSSVANPHSRVFRKSICAREKVPTNSVANPHPRVFRKSICAREKVPTNVYEYALGGIRTHETDRYQARG